MGKHTGMIRIAIDARTLGSRPSGIGMYLNDFLKQLIKYDKYEFVLFTDVAESEYIKAFVNKGIRVIAMGKPVYKSAGVYSYFNFIQRQLDEVKPDIFWEVNTIIPVKLKGSFKTMITIHDMFPIEYVEYFGLVYSFYFKHNLKKTLKNTDMILYNSEQTKKTTEKIFPEAAKIANCNAYIIINQHSKKFEITDEDFLLYVGNMEKRKGVDLLIKGFERYVQSGGTKKLIMAGKMQEEDIKELLDKTMQEIPQMEYLDYVTHDKKMELYSKCSCFVFPSKAEGFGMPVIEVMKWGKPLLVSNLDIYDEIIGDCVNKFDIKCDEKTQIENLAQGMKNFKESVDVKVYEEKISQFAPEKLGAKVVEFIDENV